MLLFNIICAALCDEQSLLQVKRYTLDKKRDDEEIKFSQPYGFFLITNPEKVYLNIGLGSTECEYDRDNDRDDDDDHRKNCDWYHVGNPSGVIQLGDKPGVVQIVARDRTSITVMTGYMGQGSACNYVVANSSLSSGNAGTLGAGQTACYINSKLEKIETSGRAEGLTVKGVRLDGTAQTLAANNDIVALSIENNQNSAVSIQSSGLTFSTPQGDSSANYGTVSQSSKPTINLEGGENHQLSSGRCDSDDCSDDWDDELGPGAIAGIVIAALVVVVIIVVVAVVAARKGCCRSETVHNVNETNQESLQREATNPSLGVSDSPSPNVLIPPAADDQQFPEVMAYPQVQYPPVNPEENPYGQLPPAPPQEYDAPYMGQPQGYPNLPPSGNPYDPTDSHF